MPDALKLLTQTASATEAELVRSLLREAGIESIVQRSIGGPEWGASGGQAVYVQPADLDRAREVLAAGESPVSDQELARQSEEAGRAPRMPED